MRYKIKSLGIHNTQIYVYIYMYVNNFQFRALDGIHTRTHI